MQVYVNNAKNKDEKGNILYIGQFKNLGSKVYLVFLVFVLCGVMWYFMWKSVCFEEITVAQTTKI